MNVDINGVCYRIQGDSTHITLGGYVKKVEPSRWDSSGEGLILKGRIFGRTSSSLVDDSISTDPLVN